MKRTNIIITFIFALVAIVVGGQTSFASEFSFAVTPVIPENQLDKSKTYFDLQLDPNQKETVYVELRNDLMREVKVDVSVNSATTNSNVIVEYGKNDAKLDKSLQYDLAKYVKAPEQVTLKPQSAVRVPFELTMPKEKFDGLLAGGITFKEAKSDTEKTKDTAEKGLAIENEYSYVVALLLRQNENTVAPEMLLHDARPDQINARNVILANLQNDKMTYINQVTIDAEITKKDSQDILYEEHKDTLQVAPNSNFDFPIHLNGDALKPGTYHIKMVINGNKAAEGEFTRGKDADGKPIHFQNQWVVEKDFTIDGEVAKELNEKDVTIKKDYTWLFILIGILLLLLALFIIWLVWRKKKKDDEEERKAE